MSLKFRVVASMSQCKNTSGIKAMCYQVALRCSVFGKYTGKDSYIFVYSYFLAIAAE